MAAPNQHELEECDNNDNMKLRNDGYQIGYSAGHQAGHQAGWQHALDAIAHGNYVLPLSVIQTQLALNASSNTVTNPIQFDRNTDTNNMNRDRFLL
jgi:hypothetical protein